MRNILTIVLVLMFSVSGFGQEVSDPQENKVEEKLILTKIEQAEYERITSKFSGELKDSLDLSKALDGVCESDWRTQKIAENIEKENSFIDFHSRNEILKSEYLKPFYSELKNFIFIVSTFEELLSVDHSEDECTPPEFREMLNSDYFFRNLFENDSLIIHHPNELYPSTASLLRANNIYGTLAKNTIKNPRKDAKHSIDEVLEFEKSPTISISEEPRYGLKAGTRIITAASINIELMIAFVEGKYQVIYFSFPD